MPMLHGSHKQEASEFARGDRRQRALKEDPNVAALPERERSKAAARSTPANLKESQGVILPRFLVEVCREEPARFVWQQRYTPTAPYPGGGSR